MLMPASQGVPSMPSEPDAASRDVLVAVARKPTPGFRMLCEIPLALSNAPLRPWRKPLGHPLCSDPERGYRSIPTPISDAL